MVTGMGLGSKETTTPATSVILCHQPQGKKNARTQQSVALLALHTCNPTHRKKDKAAAHLKNVARHPGLVAGRDPDGRANLELPLSKQERKNQRKSSKQQPRSHQQASYIMQ
jgi:hypothetical protein